MDTTIDLVNDTLKLVREYKVENRKLQETLSEIKSEIANIKRNVKSDNSDYLTGYISALSAVEGIIDEKENENE